MVLIIININFSIKQVVLLRGVLYMRFQIRELEQSDWKEVSEIYKQGIDTNVATFETTCPEYEIFDISHINICRFIISDNNTIVGWSALSSASNRCVYGGVAEISIYIDRRYQGKGVGMSLLLYTIEKSETAGFWMIQSNIIQENYASIRLHEKCGFRLVGVREKIGKNRYGQWCNVVLMEKRSLKI